MPILTLLKTTGDLHDISGLNWGSNNLNHTRKLDASIPLHLATIRANPSYFPPKSAIQNILTFTWDDGTIMNGLFEGSCVDIRNGNVYPKQISSHPHKNELGIYFRTRLGIIGNRKITMGDLLSYGRTDVEIIMNNANNYTLDFHI